MVDYARGLLHGMVWETNVESLTGKYLYSDFASGLRAEKNTILNSLTQVPFVGIVAGVARVTLGIIHTLGHLLGALFTLKKGHLFHAAKGTCEILRGMIETIPIAGRIFANLYIPSMCSCSENSYRCWWMIKIYNAEKPDGLDAWMNNWEMFPERFRVRA